MVGLLQLLVAGGDRPVLLEPVDGAPDPAARPASGAVEAHAPPRLLLLAGDDRPDPPPPQVGADAPPGVALVASGWPATRWGRRRGRPRPGRLTAPRSSSAATWVASCRWPPVRTQA